MMKTLPGSGKVVLIIEDEYTIRETLREALEIEGYSVLTAEHGKEGLNILRSHPAPNLILLDMMMPIMSGDEFLDRIALEPAHSRIPVIIISATADEKTIKGAKAFVKKPPDLEALLGMIQKFSHLQDAG